jgi:hypothetical protein
MLAARTLETEATGWRVRFLRTGAAGLALLGGCSSLKKSIDRINQSQEAYSELQGFIHDQLTSKFHRSVRSVSCTPHVDQVENDSSSNMTCVVRFTNGTSYSTQGTVTNTSTDPDFGASYSYSFYDPPGVDITTAPLPNPTVTLTAASPASLFAAHNLAPVIKRMTARFGSHELIVQLALYPGELQAVVAANGEARLVSATYSGSLKVGPQASFSGSRSGIESSQLVPGVIQHLTKLIVAKGKVPLADIDRFVLTNSLPHGDSGWNIFVKSGTTRFRSLVLGDQLVMITLHGVRVLN